MTTATQNIPTGYKQTDIGMIPADWEVKELGYGISLLSGHHVLAQYCNTEGNGFPYITGPSDFASGTIQHSKFTVKPTTICRANDILVTVKGSGAGTIVLADTAYCISRQLMAVRVTNWNARYIYYSLMKDESVFGAVATGLIPGLSRGDILKKVIPIPPTKAEQTAIASALSDVDALIEKLEKLIEKKKNIKQGAMQELLTGKRRLPGFSGEWETKNLKEIAEIYQPQTISQNKFSEDGYLVYGANGIVGKYTKYNHENWQITITCRGSTCGTVNKTTDKCWITGNAMVMNIDGNKTIDKLFFYFLLLRQDFNKCITGSGQPQIVREPLAKFEAILPKDKKEQTAIATVLSDMDTEIEKLESQLAKYRNIKQGMMQTLLTGKIRLI